MGISSNQPMKPTAPLRSDFLRRTEIGVCLAGSHGAVGLTIDSEFGMMPHCGDDDH